MKRFLVNILIFILLSNCTSFVLSPGVNSDYQIEITKGNKFQESEDYILTGFRLDKDNQELVLYDINNFSYLNPYFLKNFESISKEITDSYFTFLIEVYSEKGLDGLDKLTEIEFMSSICNNFKYQIYRYDYIKFINVRGYRSTTYPKLPEEKYSSELIPKMAYIEVKELPRKRILIFTDKQCELKKIDFKLNSQKNIIYSIFLTPSA
ncbi:hypothetical protein P3G55_18370 [Leptospira sp. 96542]|nr:hypothetical protein [Leptospira sp. 96542]